MPGVCALDERMQGSGPLESGGTYSDGCYLGSAFEMLGGMDQRGTEDGSGEKAHAVRHSENLQKKEGRAITGSDRKRRLYRYLSANLTHEHLINDTLSLPCRRGGDQVCR